MFALIAAGILATLQPDALIDDYAAIATGRFTSAAQAQSDPRYDIVEATVVRIWPEQTDGLWLYQEQAIVGGANAPAGASRERPYFQRIGHVRRLPDGRLRRDTYQIREPRRFIGFGRRAGIAAPVRGDLGAQGCHSIVQRVSPGYFTGRTEECANTYRGAVRMESLSLMTPELAINWDRGFAADGRRIWGPEEGGYIFRRLP